MKYDSEVKYFNFYSLTEYKYILVRNRLGIRSEDFSVINLRRIRPKAGSNFGALYIFQFEWEA